MMLPVGKPLVLLSVVACLAVAVAGCGSSSSSTSTTTAADGADGGTAGDTSTLAAGGGKSGSHDGDGGQASQDGGPTPSTSGNSDGGGSSVEHGDLSGHNAGAGTGNLSAGSGGPDTNDNGARLGADTKKSGDNSIESYGTEADGSEKAAIVAAMRAFDLAVATRDYEGVCAGLAEKIRSGLAESNKRCPELLETLMTIPPAEAQGSANGTVTDVRVGGGNAFVLFRAVGGSELDYFVMTLEGSGWKSLGLTVGTPLNPSVPTE
jgi:hypothetical protein